ncbi:hypothetical protein O0I10_003478 [Lichtheimia ornata]|uniref:SMP-LTD domain-containing protein n=1 Tax=Lichtheimia ornata TaxID=688661 RepID=A0AAD7V8G4_9FUNG|nr:uncharacterized protein O0I10_003478 [Lichtheimia ornata]KAJ8660835.1 hypothetical protein O0I10_003478 [Lichtheimia ornata]
MVTLTTFLTIYLFGGVTFLPLLLVGALYIYATNNKTSHTPKAVFPEEPYEDVDPEQGKKGWIRLTNHQDGVQGGKLMSGLQSYVNNGSNGTQAKKPKDVVYGVLKHGTLFVYESDKLQECKMIIPVHDFTVSIYPEGRREHEVFNRSTAIRLCPKRCHTKRNSTVSDTAATATTNGLKKSHTDTNLLDNECCSLDQDIYLTCARSIDKEDWYFALITASGFMADTPELGHVETVDGTRFDEEAIQQLIQTIHHDPDHREIQWLNAIMGRIFLGMYKTDKIHQFFKEKIIKKTRKIKRPQFLDEITVHRVHVGQTIPYFTQLKLLSIGLDGQLTAEGHVDYQGGLCVEIGTGLIWPGYSSRMKPIRLLLSVTLKRFSGKFQFKIKAPPTNRYWIGFYEQPEMDLDIKPLVSDKQIKLNVVTNAIETKIREVIAETLVLPNMDDFVFCNSGGKGGIFGDKVPRSNHNATPTPQRMDTAPQLTTTTASADSDHDNNDASSSSSSSTSIPDIEVDVSKSAPDLLTRSGPPPSDTASIDSSETVMSTTSSIRWAIRRKKKTSSDSASIASTTTEDSSKRSFLSKISTLNSNNDENSGSGGRQRGSSFYQKAETMLKASIHKDEDPTPTPQPREDNPRIAKRPPPPPPPPKPPRTQPKQPQHEETKPPLPPRLHNEQEPCEQQLQVPPPPPPRRKVEDKPPLPPRSSPRLEESSSSPTTCSSSPLPPSPPSPNQEQ